MSRQIERLERYKKNKILILKQKKKLPNDTIRKLLRPFFRSCLWIQRKINGFSVEVLNKVKVPQDRSIIFAVTHIGKWDFEIVNEQIKEQFFVIVADFMHMYGTVSGFFMRLNGVIYVDEESREDKANTKSVMIKLLQSGKNVMIFPEGTWNLSENEIIRDIAYKRLPRLFDWKHFCRYPLQIQFGIPISPNNKTAEEITGEIKQQIVAMKNK